MSLSNLTVCMPSVLTLIGIPGLESVQCWIRIPFCAMYLIAMIGNALFLLTIRSERSLHQSMYIFLAMLGATDILLATCIMPNMLGVFWFHLPDINFDCCLFQMWLIHTFQCTESSILLAMAFDCYVLICDPLRHATIFTTQRVTQIGAAVSLRVVILAAPCLLLTKCRFQFYHITVISHSYCEHMAIVKLAARNVMVNKIYGLFVTFTVSGFDLTFITLSYIYIYIY
ncbi:olfactory receptor 52A1-like, partial [Cavia porcellus]|uniref:olfactory receptor 52A1-like n=1 Tax=Cavia porcellus TaxID=10141 RepID=UPI002FDF80F0